MKSLLFLIPAFFPSAVDLKHPQARNGTPTKRKHWKDLEKTNKRERKSQEKKPLKERNVGIPIGGFLVPPTFQQPS